MDFKKTNTPLTTVTRDMIELSKDTGNVYETVCIIAKRANQIAAQMKSDLEKKLQEFAPYNDNLEEVSENREQIEISRYYERLPKPTLMLLRNILTTNYSSVNPTALSNSGSTVQCARLGFIRRALFLISGEPCGANRVIRV